MGGKTRKSNLGYNHNFEPFGPNDPFERALLEFGKIISEIVVLLPFIIGGYIAALPYIGDPLNEYNRREMSYKEAWRSFYREDIKPTLEDLTWERLKEQDFPSWADFR